MAAAHGSMDQGVTYYSVAWAIKPWEQIKNAERSNEMVKNYLRDARLNQKRNDGIRSNLRT